jgi:hypothetical protein
MEYAGVMALILVPLLILTQKGMHTIHEGHVGVYFRAGALLTDVTEPGINF